MRLGDLDALKKEFIKEFYTALGQGDDSFDVIGTMAKVIDNAPTVVVDNCGKCPYYADDDRNIIAEAFNDGYNTAREKFERPKGEWVVEKNKFGDILHCSICGARPRRSEYGYDLHDKFCNECGADMRKAEK